MTTIAVLASALFLAGAARAGADASTDVSYLDLAVAASGGEVNFKRLETFSFDFLLMHGTETIRGRDFFKFHDPQGWRCRTEIQRGTATVVAVWTSSSSWSRDDERRGSAEESATLIRSARSRFAWVWAAPLLREGSASVHDAGLRFQDGRLLRRLDVRVSPGYFPSEFTLYVDTSTAAPRIVVLSEGDNWRSLHLGSFVVGRSGLTIPTRLDFLDEGGGLLSQVWIQNAAMNEWISDGLFEPVASGLPMKAGEFPHTKGSP